MYFLIKRGIRSGDPEPEWKYWSDLQYILAQRPSCNPVVLRDNMANDSEEGFICDSSIDLNTDESAGAKC